LFKLNITNYLQNSSGLLLFRQNSSFRKCVKNVLEIGFKQQAFIIVRDTVKFTFWSTNIN
jgi:hypothetical protein